MSRQGHFVGRKKAITQFHVTAGTFRANEFQRFEFFCSDFVFDTTLNYFFDTQSSSQISLKLKDQNKSELVTCRKRNTHTKLTSILHYQARDVPYGTFVEILNLRATNEMSPAGNVIKLSQLV